MSRNETHHSDVRPGSEQSEAGTLKNQDTEPRGSEEDTVKKEHEGHGPGYPEDTSIDDGGGGEKLEELSDDWPRETGSREEEPHFEGESRELLTGYSTSPRHPTLHTLITLLSQITSWLLFLLFPDMVSIQCQFAILFFNIVSTAPYSLQ